MKDYKVVNFPEGFTGYESENGHNNWWYPNKLKPVTIPIKVPARHLHLWKNQDPMMVFAIPRYIFYPEDIFDEATREQYVAIWFHKEALDDVIDS